MKDPHTIFEEQLDHIPSEVKRFLNRKKASGEYAKTWEYYTGAYGLAFDKLAKEELEGWTGHSQITEPLFFLFRHSLELSLKTAIREYSTPAGRIAEGHSLLRLWDALRKLINESGLENGTDGWSVYCAMLVTHIHEADLDGERFRYPSDKYGQTFELTQVELEGLAVAHWHIGMYCDGAIGMLQDFGRQ